MEAINPIDLTGYEIKEPARRLSKGNTFLLKFRDVNSEDYLYEELFVSENYKMFIHGLSNGSIDILCRTCSEAKIDKD